MFIGDFVSVSESKGEAWVGDWDRGYALERFYRMVFSGVSISKDLCRGPYAIILNRLYIIIRTIVFSNAQPLVVGGAIDCQRRIGYLWAVLSAKSSNR